MERESEEYLEINLSSLLSEYFKEYSLQVFQRQLQEILIKFQEALEQNHIIYSPLCFQDEVSIIKVKQSQFSSVVTYFVSFSHFSFYVNLLHLPEQSVFKGKIEEFGKGSYGSVHLINLYGENVAIKNINLNPNAENNISKGNIKIIQNAIVEVCMIKLFFAFGVGSQLNDLFGFDLLVFQNSVVFAMEVCEQPQQESLNTLYDSLSLMHSFGIVHGDVKPENIMWSPSLKKNVFIDFGLSRVVKEKPGQKTYTAFCGTFEHSYSEMKTLLIENKKGYVDLFYNDLFGVKSSLHKCQIQKIKKTHLKTSVITQLRRFTENIKLLFYFYDQPESQLKEVCSLLSKNFYFYLTDSSIDVLSEFNLSETQMKILESVSPKTLQMQKKQQSISYQKRYFLNNLSKLALQIQSIKEFKGALCNTMIFNFFFLNVDITPFACLQKKKIMKKLLERFDPTDKETWFDFMKLFFNIQMQKYALTEIFNTVARILNSPLIEAKDYKNKMSLFDKSRLFAKHCFQKYGCNLFEINYILFKQKISTKLIEQEKYKSIISGHPQLSEQTQIFRQCELEMDKKCNNDSDESKLELFRKYLRKNTEKKSRVKIPHFLQNIFKVNSKPFYIQTNKQNVILMHEMRIEIKMQFSSNYIDQCNSKDQIKVFTHFDNLPKMIFSLETNTSWKFGELFSESSQIFQIKEIYSQKMLYLEQFFEQNLKLFLSYYESLVSKKQIQKILIKAHVYLMKTFLTKYGEEIQNINQVQKRMMLFIDRVALAKINQIDLVKTVLGIILGWPNGGQYYQNSSLFRQYVNNFKETLTSKIEKIQISSNQINLILKYSVQSLKNPENLVLLKSTIEIIKSIQSEQQMKELFFREPVISFFKNITLAMRKNPPFNIDFLVQEALNHMSKKNESLNLCTVVFHYLKTIHIKIVQTQRNSKRLEFFIKKENQNFSINRLLVIKSLKKKPYLFDRHPSPYVFLNKHIVEMVLYYYSRTELWGYKTIEIICKIMNYSRSYIHTSSQKYYTKYDILNYCSIVIKVNLRHDQNVHLFKQNIFQFLKQTVKDLAKDFQKSKGNNIIFVTLLFRFYLQKFIHLNSEQIVKLFKIANILIPFADYYLRKEFEVNAKFWCLELLKMNMCNPKQKRFYNLMRPRLNRIPEQNYQWPKIIFYTELCNWSFDPKEKKDVVQIKNRIRNKIKQIQCNSSTKLSEQHQKGDLKMKGKSIKQTFNSGFSNPFTFVISNHDTIEIQNL